MSSKILAKTLVLLSLGILATGCIAAEKYYDSTGKYMGEMDKNGRLYDNTGKYKGQLARIFHSQLYWLLRVRRFPDPVSRPKRCSNECDRTVLTGIEF